MHTDTERAGGPEDEASSGRASALRIEREEFRRLGHALVDAIAEFLERVPDRPVTTAATPAEVQAILDAGAPLPDEGMAPGALLDSAARLLFDHSLLNGHPRFFGYITSSPTPIGMLGDLLAAAVNPNVGAWRLSPIASEIEAQTVRWIAELLGYPTSCGGLLVSGGNMANIVGLFAARAAIAGATVRSAGMQSTARRLRVYASAETHTWLQKGADLAGLGTDAVHWIETDDELRMNVSALRDAIVRDLRAGERPMMVVGTAGSVSTGAIDPLREIAEVCRAANVWLHVDGAYGAFAAAVPGAAPALDALALADSVAVDPHKWLYAPLEAGCVLVRDESKLRDAFAYHPPYYRFGQAAVNYVDLGPQNSRGFRALKVWLALRQVGRQGYVRSIAQDIALSRRMHARVAAHPELEPGLQSLSISTFRYVPPRLRAHVGTAETERYLNTLNEELLERIQNSGALFLSNAVVRGRLLLRACIVNFNTGASDVDAVPELVARMGREVDAELRAD